MKLGVLISGRGSNMIALAEACAQPDFPADVAVVIANQEHAPGLEMAAALGIATHVVSHEQFDHRAAFETALLKVLHHHQVELVCLAGFMRLLSAHFVDAFAHRILNVHPSLLPSFPGGDAHRDAIEYGVRLSGCTVHFVTLEMDAGPIVVQAAVPVRQDDTVETLSARILEHEHRIYPQAVRLIAEDRVRVIGRRVQIQES